MGGGKEVTIGDCRLLQVVSRLSAAAAPYESSPWATMARKITA